MPASRSQVRTATGWLWAKKGYPCIHADQGNQEGTCFFYVSLPPLPVPERSTAPCATQQQLAVRVCSAGGMWSTPPHSRRGDPSECPTRGQEGNGPRRRCSGQQ